MTGRQKKIAVILLGFTLIVGAIVWLEFISSCLYPIPALTLSAGLIAVFGTIKQALIDYSAKENK